MLILRQKSFEFCTPLKKTPQPVLPYLALKIDNHISEKNINFELKSYILCGQKLAKKWIFKPEYTAMYKRVP